MEKRLSTFNFERRPKYTQSCSLTENTAIQSWHSTSDADNSRHISSVKFQINSCVDRIQPIKEETEKTPLINNSMPISIAPVYLSVDLLGQSHLAGESLQVGPGISWLSVAFGLANAGIGVGVLNYPAAYDKIGGVQIATFAQIFLVLVIMLSMLIIIYCADLSKSRSYHEVLLNVCGKRAEILVALDVFLATFGVCIAYIVIIGDEYDRIFASFFGDNFCHYWYLNRKFTITLTALFIAPVCYFKQLNFLRHTGPLGIISMIYVVFLTIYQHYTLTDANKGVERTKPDSVINVLAILPVMCFGYQCNEVIVPIYASMKQRDMKTFFKAAALAWSVLLLLYCLVGYFGYITFGSKVLPDITQMFDAKDPIVLIGIIALIIKMAVTYPQMSFVGRGAFDGIYGYLTKKDSTLLLKKEKKRRYIVASVWFVTTLFLGLFAPDIGLVIEALGTLSIANVFIFPSVCLISLCRRKDLGHGLFLKTCFILIAFLLLLIGIGALILVIRQVYIDIELIDIGPTSLCAS